MRPQNTLPRDRNKRINQSISFEFSYTISNKWTETLNMSVSISSKQLLKIRVCFNIEETISLKGLLLKQKNMLHIGSVFFPLKVDPM